MTDLIIPTEFSGTQTRSAEIVDATDTGEVRMKVVPYDVEEQLGANLYESFAPGTFARAANAPSRAKLWLEHSNQLIGCGTVIEEQADGLYMTAKFANTTTAAEARELCTSGMYDSVSVEFRTLQGGTKFTRDAKGVHARHTRAHLLGCALVGRPQYLGATVLSARDEISAAIDAAEAKKAEAQAILDRLKNLRA